MIIFYFSPNLFWSLPISIVLFIFQLFASKVSQAWLYFATGAMALATAVLLLLGSIHYVHETVFATFTFFQNKSEYSGPNFVFYSVAVVSLGALLGLFFSLITTTFDAFFLACKKPKLAEKLPMWHSLCLLQILLLSKSLQFFIIICNIILYNYIYINTVFKILLCI